jgi:dihydropyrimidine dehydrogenase (NAD+) subunit PreT
VRLVNPLGEVCGLVCPARSLCELACVRAEMDSPVRISELEEFTCGVSPGPESWPEAYRGRRRDRVAVIGSGPASLSCAFFLSIQGFNVEVFEQGIQAGGLPAQAMPDFKLNRQLLEREMEGSLMSGVQFRGNTIFGDDIDLESLRREGFRAVFLGTGLQSMKMPSIRGSDLPGVIDALSFLTAARRRVKRELTSQVAVIGETNLAVDCAVLAREMGAETVYLVTAHRLQDCPLAPQRLEAAEAAAVTTVADRRIIEVRGEGRVEGLRTHPNTGTPGEGAEVASVLDVGTVIVAWDQEIEPALGGYLSGHIGMGPTGLVVVDENMMTSRPGVFAGGDLTSGGGLVVEACADGRVAALAIGRYLEPGDDAGEPSEGPAAREPAARTGLSPLRVSIPPC